MMDAGTFLFLLQAGGTTVEPGAVEPIPDAGDGDCYLEVLVTPKGAVEGHDPEVDGGDPGKIRLLVKYIGDGQSFVVQNPTTINEQTIVELAELIHGM